MENNNNIQLADHEIDSFRLKRLGKSAVWLTKQKKFRKINRAYLSQYFVHGFRKETIGVLIKEELARLESIRRNQAA